MAPQKSVIYSFVSRRHDAFIVAEYADAKGDFTLISKRLITELPPLEGNFSYLIGGLRFIYHVREQYTVVSAGFKIPTAFLLGIEHDFFNNYAENADEEFRSKLKVHMFNCLDRLEEIRQDRSLRPPQVLEVRAEIMEDILRVLDGQEIFDIHRSIIRTWCGKITPKLIAIIGVLVVIFFLTLGIVHVVSPRWSG